MPASETKKSPGIFISYRRSDTPDAVGRIYDRLIAEFGKARVFKDVDSIPLGQDFRGHLNDIVGECAAVLAIIGPKWADIRNEAGQKRLEDPDDFVRIELEAALARNVPVVPVLVGHALMPGVSQLPSTLSSLAFRQAIEVRPDPDFHNDATRLVVALQRILDPSAINVVDSDRASASRGATVASLKSKARFAWTVAVIFGLAATAVAVPAWKYFHQPLLPEFRSEITTPDTDRPLDFALSPDGRQIAYVAADNGVDRLWLRALDSVEAHPLPGTDGAMSPFWSPDNASLGFFRNNSLNRIDIKNGQSRVIVPTSSNNPGGASWSTDGVILFAPSGNGPLLKVSAAGGDVTVVTKLDAAQRAHVEPQLLPDGQHFLFQAIGTPKKSGTYIGSLGGAVSTRLTESITAVSYLPSGWMAFEREGSLMAQRLDVGNARLVGDPVTLNAVGASKDSGIRRVSVAGNGLIACRSSAGGRRQLQWFNRNGQLLGTLGDADSTLSNPRVSPDGRRVAVERTVSGNTDIWLLDGTHSTRLTFDSEIDARPLWSFDSRAIIFYSFRTGTMDLYSKSSDGAGAETRLFDADAAAAADRIRVPTSISRDGRYLLYMTANGRTAADLQILPLNTDRKPGIWLQTSFNETWGEFSPNGQWVAYASDDSRRSEIYVRQFHPTDANSVDAAASDARGQISAAGGLFPLWRPDGKELYFLSPSGDMMSASISATTASITSGTPVKLFATRIFGAGRDGTQGRQYDVAPDGRFLINSEIDTGTAPPIVLIQNWNPDAGK